MNFYNEIDPFAAAWLRELIKARCIAPGVVDERSIEDIKPDELLQYTQCHFFAGIGVWSYALRLAGWPDDRPVWTGSCPCQPFSAAGKGVGTSDERHLWPAFFHLISACKPRTIFGEQVEAAIRHGWLDLVQDDMEGIGYAFGAVGFPAASVGAPHIRQRLYFVAESNQHQRRQEREVAGRSTEGSGTEGMEQRFVYGGDGSVAESDSRQRNRLASSQECQRDGKTPGRIESDGEFECRGEDGNVADSTGIRQPGRRERHGSSSGLQAPERSNTRSETSEPCSTLGFWKDAEWINCLDDRQRPVEPGSFPLVNGAANRVGRLRGYGNAIVAPQAEAFVRAFMEVENLQ